MTRFQKEISGQLGEFWVKSALNEAKKAVSSADKDAVVEPGGAIRWKVNGSYLMDDFCEKLEYMEYPFSREVTKSKREKQTEEKLAGYQSCFTNEVLQEARAAFGKNATVVDIISKERVTV